MNRLTLTYLDGFSTLDAEQFPPLDQKTLDSEIKNSNPIRIAIGRLAELEYKQVPKQLDYEAEGYDDNGELIYDTAYCPRCRYSFEVDYESPNYCPDCGQALDWSNIEEEGIT